MLVRWKYIGTMDTYGLYGIDLKVGIKVGTNPESFSRFSRRHISGIFMGGAFFLYTAEIVRIRVGLGF